MDQNPYTKKIDELLETFFEQSNSRYAEKKTLGSVISEKLSEDDFLDVYAKLKRFCDDQLEKAKTPERKETIEAYYLKCKSEADTFFINLSKQSKVTNLKVKDSAYDFLAARYNAGLFALFEKHPLYPHMNEAFKKAIESVRLDIANDLFYPFEASSINNTPSALMNRGRKPVNKNDDRRSRTSRIKSAREIRIENELAAAEDDEIRRERHLKFQRFDELINVAAYLNLTTRSSIQLYPPVYQILRDGLSFEKEDQNQIKEHYVIISEELELWYNGLLKERSIPMSELSSRVQKFMIEDFGKDKAETQRYLCVQRMRTWIPLPPERGTNNRGRIMVTKIEIPNRKPMPTSEQASSPMKQFSLAAVIMGDQITTTALFHPSMLTPFLDLNNGSITSLWRQEEDCDVDTTRPENKNIEDMVHECSQNLISCGQTVKDFSWKHIQVRINELVE